MLGFSPRGLSPQQQVTDRGDVPFHHLALAEVHHLGVSGIVGLVEIAGTGQPKLFLNQKEIPATVAAGYMELNGH